MRKEIIIALRSQLTAFPALAYAHESGYIAEDPYDLIQTNKFPFFNIIPTPNSEIGKVDNVSFREMESHIIPILIQFATRSIIKNVAVMGDGATIGILDFMEDLWDGVSADRTIGGTVGGINPGTTIMIDVLELEDKDRIFIAGAELTIEFYKDIAL